MCGIVGIASSVASPRRETLDKQRDAMEHRGPDDAGTWWSPDGRVGLAHRRLSIIDLSSAGHQPMADAGKRAWITFNGEIYNYTSLRDQLIALGHRFSTQTDTEVVLESYHEWGDDCLSHLEGMFAFGIYDVERQRLLVARDRMGEKPLYYSFESGVLRFASELKALLADTSFPRRVNSAALDEYLTYGYVTAPRCILEGVSKLRPGAALSYDLTTRNLREWIWWSLPASTLSIGDDDVVTELHELLERAIRRQLVADVPVGILLSGGLDSSLVAALAARASSEPVRTYTVTFPGSGTFDEAAHAKLVASHIGSIHTELEGGALSADLLPKLARQFDEPLGDSSLIPTYVVSTLIRQSATVALGGDGGDELFGGYPMYDRFLRQERLRRVVPRVFRRLVGSAAQHLPQGMRGRNDLLSFGGDIADRMANARVMFDQRTRAKILAPMWKVRPRNGAGPETARAALSPLVGSPLRRMTEMDVHSYLADDILAKVDRASMLASLEVRAPFLDPSVVSFAFGRLPDHWRATPTGRKMILRALARRVLPQQMDVARKQGFSIPLTSWLRGEWGQVAQRILADVDASVFDRARIAQLFDGVRRGRELASPIFALLMFELWRREYNVAAP